MNTATATKPFKKQILIAEDDDATAALLVRILRKEYDVTRVADGLEALIRLKRDPLPCLLLLDVTMPKIDGLAVARAVRTVQGGARLPIIFVSALSTPMDVVKGIQAGAKHYVTKPFDVEDLLSKIKRTVRP